MTLDEAYEAKESLTDVFTPDGDAGCIDRIVSFRGMAHVVGRNVFGWFLVSDLTTSDK